MRRWFLALAGISLAGLAWGTDGTLSAWTGAVVVNSVDTSATGGLAITHTYAASCIGAVRVASVACSPALQPSAGAPASANDSITNNSGRAVTQSLTASSCGPARLVNAQQSADPMLPRNAVTFRRTDSWGTTSAIGLSGQGYATDIVGTNGGGVLGLLANSYSIGLWFNAADAQGGGLLSLSNTLSNGAGTANPTLWLDTTGHVHYAVRSTLGISQAASTGTYASGWHFAVLTVLNVAGLTETMTLYVDGAQQATSTALALLTAVSGYWHLGWSDFTGLAAPTSAYFHGSVSGVFVDQTTALSAGTVSSLYAEASASSYSTSLAGVLGIASVWMLGDDGTTTYAGALPGAMAAPCTQVNVTLTFTNPAATIGPIGLDAFVLPANNPRTVAAPAAGSSQSLTVATTKAAAYSTDIAGLRLYVPMSFAYGTSPATSWTQALQWSGDPGDVFLA